MTVQAGKKRWLRGIQVEGSQGRVWPEPESIILSSSVDASGNPNFLSAGAGLVLNISGATTPLRLLISGLLHTCSVNTSITLTASKNQFVYAAATVSGYLDSTSFGASEYPPDYDYVAPTGPATDQHWFNLSDNQMYRYSGAAWVAVNRIFLGVARTSGAAIDGVVCEPYRLSPQKRFELFGNASDGILEVTGATTVDGYKDYSFVRVDGATLTSSDTLDTSPHGLHLSSQNPVLIINAGIVSVNGKGRGAAAGTSGGGIAGGNGGFYIGAGGGGGGAGVTNAGGIGGGFIHPKIPDITGGQGSAGAVKTAGGLGKTASTSRMFWPFSFHLVGVGAAGGTGGGDGTRVGGNAGNGGGLFRGFAPAWLISATSSIAANGNNGTAGGNGGGANLGGGGGGGGGGGIAVVGGGYINNLGTISATGGTGGAGGTNDGAAGGDGGAGTALAVRLW